MEGKDRNGIKRTVLTTPTGQLAGMGSLTDAAINGRLFHTASQAAATTSATLTAAHVGLLVGNPKNSGKYLVMHEFGWGCSASITAEGALGIVTGPIGDMATQAGTTNVAYPSLIGGSASSIALVDITGTTAGTLILAKIIGEADDTAATAASYGTDGVHVIDLKGSLVISPGYCIGTETTAVAGAVMWFHFQWEEIDI